MTTVQAHLELVRHILEGDQETEIRVLGSNMANTTGTSLVLDDVTAIEPGDLIEVGTELMLNRGVDTGTTLTVIRGWRGTTAATHDSGDYAYIRPWLDMGLLLDYAKAEILSWPDSIFATGTFDVTVSKNTEPVTVDLPTINGLREIMSVSGYRINDATYAFYTSGTNDGYKLYRRGKDGNAVLHFFKGMPQDTTILVDYAYDFDVEPFQMATDLEQVVGLNEKTLDILTYGLMWRALIGKEGRRLNLDSQGTARTDEAVQVGDGFRVGGAYKQVRDTRIADEAMRLRRRYGLK